MVLCIDGSPPRVRGTDDPASISFPASGITPACAGNRPATAYAKNPPRDHPRVCGEQISRNRHGLCI